MFHVGQLVVCIDDKEPVHPLATPGCMDGLTAGRIYTVRELSGPTWLDGRPTIKLEEIVREPDDGYWAHRFRPVRDTSIEIFREAVKHLPIEIDANV